MHAVWLIAIALGAAESNLEHLQRCADLSGVEEQCCTDELIRRYDSTACESIPRKRDTGWRTRTDKDPMDDSVSCVVLHKSKDKASPIFAWISSEATPSIAFFGDQFPGREHGFRVDTQKAYTTRGDGLSGSIAENAVREAKAGTRLRTQIIEWPSGAPINWGGELTGFAAAAADCEAYVRRITAR